MCWCDPDKHDAMVKKVKASRKRNAALRAAEQRAEKLATNIVVEADEASGEGALTLPVAMVKKVKASRKRNAALRAAEQRAEKLAIKRALDEKDAFENAISYMTRRVGDIVDDSQACMLEQEALGVVRSFMAARDYPDYEREARSGPTRTRRQLPSPNRSPNRSPPSRSPSTTPPPIPTRPRTPRWRRLRPPTPSRRQPCRTSRPSGSRPRRARAHAGSLLLLSFSLHASVGVCM